VQSCFRKLTRPLETALRAAGVRYHLIGGQSFSTGAKCALLAYLKIFINPHDDVSLLRIANTPARGRRM
jgi:superfamily I DNA/RNA helicase